MKLTFISNYMNHHQKPFCDACYRALGQDFAFIQTMPVAADRQALGWAASFDSLPYLHLYYETEAGCRRLLEESDIILLGWLGGADFNALEEEILAPSLRTDAPRPVLRLSERIYKTGQWKAVSPRGLAAKKRQHLRYRHAPVYLLCQGAYVASDYSLIGAYPGKMFRWGYFPEISGNTADSIPNGPEADGGQRRLIWAGRMIPWKHPEYPIRLAATLQARGFDFHLTMVGDGRLRGELEQETASSSLSSLVTFTGALPPAEVRSQLAQAQIGLFTSNYLEGWGAVVNEMMESGLAVLASSEAGAVPCLIRNGINGLTYDRGDYHQFEEAACALMAADPERLRGYGCHARETIQQVWNGPAAARELLRVCDELMAGKEPTPAPGDGPMSLPERLTPPGFLRSLHENHTAEGL
ncbi:MAG: glycosyltransferase [Butyrivibrio sp.]|nr:glycosyltransferase [Butyrivibrio sp.]